MTPQSEHEPQHESEPEQVASTSGQLEDGASTATADVAPTSAAARLAEALLGLDLASDDTTDASAPRVQTNDESLRREVPPHHV